MKYLIAAVLGWLLSAWLPTPLALNNALKDVTGAIHKGVK